MSRGDLRHDILIIDHFGWQAALDHLYDLFAREQLNRVSQRQSFLGKEHRGNHRHVAAPTIPFTTRVFGHAARTLGLLEGLLDKKTQALPARQFMQAGIGSSVAQAIFDFRSIEFTPNQQMPTARMGFLAVSCIYLRTEK